jgi:hypothetical protein
MVEVLVSENVSSMVPAAPSDPYSPTWSCEGWQEVVDAVVVVATAVVVVVATALVVVVVVEDVVVVPDVRAFGVLLVHAPRRDPAATTITTAAALTDIDMVPLPSRACACPTRVWQRAARYQGRRSQDLWPWCRVAGPTNAKGVNKRGSTGERSQGEEMWGRIADLVAPLFDYWPEVMIRPADVVKKIVPPESDVAPPVASRQPPAASRQPPAASRHPTDVGRV